MYGPYIPFLHCTQQRVEQEPPGLENPEDNPSKKQCFDTGNSKVLTYKNQK